MPDFLLVVAIVLSLERSQDAAATTGFAAGLFMGAIHNQAIAAFTLSRMVACIVGARISASFLDKGPFNLSIVAFLCTLLSGVIYLFVIPFIDTMPGIGAHVADTIGAAIYNGVIAIPIHLLYQRVAGTAARV
jgi:rod shape-determining protein MreD